MNVWYNVCNDYSLKRRDYKPNDLDGMEKFIVKDERGRRMEVYQHDEEEGPIYLFGPEGREELDI